MICNIRFWSERASTVSLLSDSTLSVLFIYTLHWFYFFGRAEHAMWNVHCAAFRVCSGIYMQMITVFVVGTWAFTELRVPDYVRRERELGHHVSYPAVHGCNRAQVLLLAHSSVVQREQNIDVCIHIMTMCLRGKEFWWWHKEWRHIVYSFLCFSLSLSLWHAHALISPRWKWSFLFIHPTIPLAAISETDVYKYIL